MPNEIRYLSPYIKSGNPDVYNEPTLYAPGDLGASWDANDRTYEVVQLDSGATSATPVGSVAANMLAFWKSKTNRIVTNDARVAIGGQTTSGFRNNVAGIFRGSITAGYYTMILTRGHGIPIKSASGPVGIGDGMIASTNNTQAQAINVAAGTAPSVQCIGYARADGTGSNVTCDIDIPDLA